jgi:hypothetical protein
LKGYDAEYTDTDHHLNRLQVMLQAGIGGRIDEGWEAFVVAQFNLRDDDADDPFRGSIDFVLFVETEGILPPVVFE